MLAPLSRMTLTVVAALLISFVDGTFESDRRSADPVDSPAMVLAYDGESENESVQLRAQVGTPGLTCTMRVTYEDGATDVLDDVKADPDGVCTSVFALSERQSATDLAEVQLEVTNELGTVEGESTRTFALMK